MDLREIDILHVVRRVIVFDLSSRPVQTLNLDDFIVGDLPIGRDYQAGLR